MSEDLTARFVDDRKGEIVAILREFARPDAGVIGACCRPGTQHLDWMMADLMASLNHGTVPGGVKRLDLRAAKANAISWMAAEAVADIVLAHAEWLYARQATELIQLADLIGARCWLVFDTVTPNWALDLAQEFHSAWLPPSCLTEMLPPQPTASRDAAAADIPFPAVPQEAVPTFLASAERGMGAVDFARVKEVFLAGFDTMRGLLAGGASPNEERIARSLHAASASYHDDGAVLVFLRGGEAAALRSGWLLRFDICRLTNRATNPTALESLTADQWAVVAATERPHRAATAVLACAGMSVDGASSCTTDQVARDGSWVRVEGEVVPIPVAARKILVAQHLYRLMLSTAQSPVFLLGAAGGEAVRPRTVAITLESVGKHTGIVIRAMRSSWKGGEAGWRHRWGLSITKLRAFDHED
ncbi:MAG: hypothetical protein ACYDEA_04085 [Candidatus Dormibacteria bacterium]